MRKNRFSFVTDAFRNRGDHSDTHASRKGQEPSLDLLEQMGYETRDLVLPTIRNWILALFVFIGVMTALAMGAYLAFVPNYEEKNHAAPLTMQRRLPPNPQLQVHPKRDMILYHRSEDSLASGYTWVDRKKGTVSIPIDAAIDQMAQKGISGVTSTAPGTPASSDSYPGSGQYTNSAAINSNAPDGNNANVGKGNGDTATDTESGKM